jgi:hypothetical protein
MLLIMVLFSWENYRYFSQYSRAYCPVAFEKGTCMTSLAFMECCQRLSVTPKTLRQWLAQAETALHPHPTDARITCLTSEQLQFLAALHGRVLQPSGVSLTNGGVEPGEATNADLRIRLAQVEAQVVTLQSQLTDLALQLLKEREQRTERRLQRLEGQFSLTDVSLSPQKTGSVPCEQTLPPFPDPPPKRKSKQLIPLIEYGARGHYLLLCPDQGELHFDPDSPEWFAWLETLNSFRFVGQQGRLSASRNRGRPCWMAYRRIHGHCYTYGLGNTKRLTIDHLEQMAATLQSHTASL